MKFKQVIALSVATAVLCASFVLTKTTRAYSSAVTDTKVFQCTTKCTLGSFDTKTISTPSGTVTIPGSQINCPHGSCGHHYYDKTTGLVSGITCAGRPGIPSDGGYNVYVGGSVAGRTYGSPNLQSATGFKVDISILGSNLQNYCENLTITISGTTIEDYMFDTYLYTVKITSTNHVPFYFLNIKQDSVEYDSNSATVYVRGDLLKYMEIGLAPFSGYTCLLNMDSSTLKSHNATKCKDEDPVITGEHKDLHVSSHSETWYDSAGNLIGGAGGATVTCGVCGAYTSSGGSSGFNSGYEDYTGPVYNENGQQTGYISSSDNTNIKYGKGVHIINQAYQSSTPVSSSNECITVTYNPCAKHNNLVGPHYYCTQHNYIGTSSICYYDTAMPSGSDSYVWRYQSTITCKGGVSAYVDRVSATAGTINAILNPTSANIRYTISSGGTTISSGIAAGNVSYTMPAGDVQITVEPGKQDQTVTVIATFNKTYNNPQFNLGATVI